MRQDVVLSDLVRGRTWASLHELRSALLAVAIAPANLPHIIGWATRFRSLRCTAFHHAWISQSIAGDNRQRLDLQEMRRVPVPDRLWSSIDRADRSDDVEASLDWERGYASLQIISPENEWPFNLWVWESILVDVPGLQVLVNELSRDPMAAPAGPEERRAWIKANGADLNSKQAWAQFSRENNPARRGLLADFMADYKEIWPRKQGRPRKLK